MKAAPVSLEDRQKAVDATLRRLSDAAAEWTEAKASGYVPNYLEQALKDAMHQHAVSIKRYEKAHKRLNKV